MKAYKMKIFIKARYSAFVKNNCHHKKTKTSSALTPKATQHNFTPTV